MSNFFELLKYKYIMNANLKRRASYIIKNGESLEDVCRRFNIDVSSVKLYNMIKNVKAGDVIFFSESKNGLYVVKPADTFEGVAKKLGLSQKELFNLTGTTRLFIGQRIEF